MSGCHGKSAAPAILRHHAVADDELTILEDEGSRSEHLRPVGVVRVNGDVGNGAPAAEAPATWFGLAVDVDDLDQTAGLLGEGLGRIKVAVQDGRRIATFKTKQFDVSVAIAAMDHRGDR